MENCQRKMTCILIVSSLKGMQATTLVVTPTKFIKIHHQKKASQSFISIRLLVPFPLLFLDRKTRDAKIISDIPNHKRDESTIGNQCDN